MRGSGRARKVLGKCSGDDFGGHFGVQNRSKIDQIRGYFFDQNLEGIFDGFGMDLGAIFELFGVKKAFENEKGENVKIYTPYKRKQ